MNGLNMLDAVSAYNRAGSLDNRATSAAAGTSGDFTSMIEKALSETKDKLDVAETATSQSVTGDISMEDLAISVANAEVSLRSLIAIRDKLVTALQDILRMPI